MNKLDKNSLSSLRILDENRKPQMQEYTHLNKDFITIKDKIIIIGSTAMSLYDTKSVPVQETVYPGVEVHATFFNNMLDNNFIKQLLQKI